MATLPKTSQKKEKMVTEAEIEAVINKGGKTLAESDFDSDQIKFVSVRFTKGIINQINEERKSRPRKPGSPKPAISLRDWILEAALEKLERLKNES